MSVMSDVHDMIEQQKEGKRGPVCLLKNVEYSGFLKKSLPDLEWIEPWVRVRNYGDIIDLFVDGICEVVIFPYWAASHAIYYASEQNTCLGMNGKPIGMVGQVIDFGFSQVAMGIRMDLPHQVDQVINYWMSYLMTCSPAEDTCDSFSKYYRDLGTDGSNCGYVAFPTEEDEQLLTTGGIVAVVLGVVAIPLLVGLALYFYCSHLTKVRRVKKRFVQQIARNLAIGKNPHDIPAEELAKLFEHIAGKTGTITEEDFRSWMADVNLKFLSENELKYLYTCIDSTTGKGMASSIDLIMFLVTCKREFGIVSTEIEGFSKTEKLKFTSQRLETLKEIGKDGARKREFEINRRSRQNIFIPANIDLFDDSENFRLFA